MANVGRISGAMLRKNLLRYGEDLSFENDLIYLEVTDVNNSANHKVGIKTTNPLYPLHINGTTFSTELLGERLIVDNVAIDGNDVRSNLGQLNIRTNVPANDFLTIDSRTLKLTTTFGGSGAAIDDATSELNLKGNIEVKGNIHATGSITADGNLVLGDNQNVDTVEFKADIKSDIIPDADNLYDLGKINRTWKEIYGSYLKIDNIVVDGNDIKSYAGNLNLRTNTTNDYLTVDSRTFKLTTIDAVNGISNLDLQGNLDVQGDVNIDGGDFTVSTTTFNLVNTTATTVNFAGTATTIEIGAATGTTNINHNLDIDGDVNIDGGDLTVSTTTFNLANTTATTINAFGAATDINIGATTGITNIKNNLSVDGNVALGNNQAVDTVEFKAYIKSNIIPTIDDVYDLGTLTQSWRQVYVDDMRLGGAEFSDLNNPIYSFSQTSIPGSGTLPAKTFTGMTGINYTKISNTFNEGHLALASNGNGLIELINDTRLHNDLNVLGDVATDNANYILMGDPEYGILDGAVEMTQQTSLTDGVAQLNLTLTLLVPLAPPDFPNNQNLIITNTEQRILNVDPAFQSLNGTGITPPSAGSVVYVSRVNTFTTSSITATGPGNRGSLKVIRNSYLFPITKQLYYGNTTQVITAKITETTTGVAEIRYEQPKLGVLVPGYIIKITSGTPFGGFNINDTFVITTITSKIIKLSVYNTTAGSTQSPFIPNSNGSGQLTFITLNDNGTFTANGHSLTISNNLAYPTDTPGFHEIFDINLSGDTIWEGWHTLKIEHDQAGSTNIGSTSTNIGIWYYDDTVPAAPIFSSENFTLGNSSIIYSSTVPHYTSATTYNIGFIVNWNAGKTGHSNTSQNILTTGSQDIWSNVGNKTYNSFGYSILPISTTVTNGSGPNSQSFIVNIKSGFGLWTNTSTVPVFTANNGYLSANSALPSLGKQILFKTGTTSSTTFLDETNIFFNAAVGGSTTPGATRCINPDVGIAGQDTPVFTAGSTLFNSQTGTLYVTDAIVVGTNNNINSLTHNVTNYSTGYLPAGPDFSTRSATDPQYFTFRFVRSGLSKFRIRWTTPGGIAGIWAALPGANGTSLKSGQVNSWLSAAIDNSLAGGCALGGNLPTGAGTNQVNISFGTLSSTNSTNNEIWVRIRLNQGQSMTSLYLDVSDQ